MRRPAPAGPAPPAPGAAALSVLLGIVAVALAGSLVFLNLPWYVELLELVGGAAACFWSVVLGLEIPPQ